MDEVKIKVGGTRELLQRAIELCANNATEYLWDGTSIIQLLGDQDEVLGYIDIEEYSVGVLSGNRLLKKMLGVIDFRECIIYPDKKGDK